MDAVFVGAIALLFVAVVGLVAGCASLLGAKP